MALGAQRANILGMVLREVLLLVGIGVVLGIAESFATTRLAQATVSGLLFGLKINYATVIVFAAVVLMSVATLAGWVPAWRASRADPMVALRYE